MLPLTLHVHIKSNKYLSCFRLSNKVFADKLQNRDTQLKHWLVPLYTQIHNLSGKNQYKSLVAANNTSNDIKEFF